MNRFNSILFLNFGEGLFNKLAFTSPIFSEIEVINFKIEDVIS